MRFKVSNYLYTTSEVEMLLTLRMATQSNLSYSRDILGTVPIGYKKILELERKNICLI